MLFAESPIGLTLLKTVQFLDDWLYSGFYRDKTFPEHASNLPESDI